MYPDGLETGDVHKSLCIISKERELTEIELVKESLTCFPKGHEWQIKEGFLLHFIKLEENKEYKTPLPGWPKRECQILEDKAEKADEGVEVAPCVDLNG